MSPVLPFPEDDLNNLLSDNKEYLAELTKGRVLLTGGTGFIGRWFLSLFALWNQFSNDKILVWIPSRNPVRFLEEYPHLNTKEFLYFEGDIRTMILPEGRIETVIHAATDVGDPQKAADYATIFDVCVQGTAHLLEVIKRRGVKRFLLLSSGAVYGRQDPNVERITEDSPSSLDPTKSQSAYGEGKRVSEWLVAQAGRENGFHVAIARCFAFIGPGLTLEGPFAVGNFLNGIISNQMISIKGDGTTLRSYLYITDLVSWLLVLLFKGASNEAYNVGDDQPISIKQLAETIAGISKNKIEITILKIPDLGKLPERYVPDISKIKKLNVKQNIILKNGLINHYQWLIKEKI